MAASVVGVVRLEVEVMREEGGGLALMEMF